jgi:transketolase
VNGSRYAYLKRICELAEKNKNVVIVSADYAAPIFDSFKRDYTRQYISVGIAEQNLIAVSCGLAMAGKRVVAYGLSPFPALRAYDQIKCALSNMRLPVNIAVAGTGFSEYGITHSNIEDISLMRTIPNMQIITPTDNIMGIAAADFALVNSTPVYLRFDKYAEGEIYTHDRKIDFQHGFEILRDGSDIAVITFGSLTANILELAIIWQTHGINTKIIDLYSLPFNIDAFLSVIKDIPILIIEEHILQGGMGSMILEICHEHGLTNYIQRMGINFNNEYPQTSGSRDYYLEKYGLSNNAITTAVFKIVNNKI